MQQTLTFLRAIAFAACLAAVPAAAQQFSADVMNSSGGQARPPGKLYSADGKLRMEGGGGQGAVLVDRTQRTAYVVMPAQKMYMDLAQQPQMNQMNQMMQPVDANNACPQLEAAMQQMPRTNGATWTCKQVGPETVNGRSAIKYEATSSAGEHSQIWIDPKLKFAVKAEGSNGTMELRNIVEGPQPASLFEIPQGYRKLDMGGMMQQMMQQRLQQGGPPHP